MRNLKSGYERVTGLRKGKLFEIKLGRFFEIGDCFLNIVSLTYRADLGAFGDIQICFFMKDSRKRFEGHMLTSNGSMP